PQLYLKPTRASDKVLKGLSLDELHRVEVIVPGSAQMEHRGNICMSDFRSRACFAEETKPRRFVTQISLVDDFQCHGALQIDVERLVSDPHCTATQLDRSTVFTRDQSVMLKMLFHLFGCRVYRNLGSRRLAGLNPARQSLAKHAHWTELHFSRE